MNPDMTPNLVLVVVVVALVSTGVYLMLERSLTRVIIGLMLVSNGVNVMFLLAGGQAGGAPIVGTTEVEEMSDPLPQAMVLTAIVITLGMTAFLLAMAYRSWQLNRHDEVQDDLEDRRIARMAAADQPAYTDTDAQDTRTDLDVEAAEARDETGEREDSEEVVRA
jgi:multicomponent Na+:H+ antiporter subunit C